jgi:hypothetical protein
MFGSVALFLHFLDHLGSIAPYGLPGFETVREHHSGEPRTQAFNTERTEGLSERCVEVFRATEDTGIWLLQIVTR